MDVVRRDQDDITVLECPSNFDVEAGGALRVEADAAVAAGRKLLVADLAQTTFMGSAGMSALLTVAKRLRAADGYLVVANATGLTAASLKMVGVNRTVDMFDSLDEAIASLRAWSD